MIPFDKLKPGLMKLWESIEFPATTNQKVLQHNHPDAHANAIEEPLPDNGIEMEELLEEFSKRILPGMNHNLSPGYSAYITGRGNPAGALAESIKGIYNQNALKWNNSPVASELEKLVVKWVANFCLLPQHTHGFLTSGGSMSNYLCLHQALINRYPAVEHEGIAALPKIRIYGSDQTHSSIDRAMVFLGLGRNAFIKINTIDYQIDLDALQRQIEADIKNGFTPMMVVGNAGTTNTGSVDNLEGLAEIAGRYDLWFHVDGAYGLPAIRLNEKRSLFNGIEKADSVIINPHKWLYVPFEAGCVLLRELRDVTTFQPDYLRDHSSGRWESSRHTIELSKEFRALKVWFTLKYYGAEQIISFIRHDVHMTELFARKLVEKGYWEVEPVHPLSILCFRYHDSVRPDDENENINRDLLVNIESDGAVFFTGTRLHDTTYLRVYFGNPDRREEDLDFMIHQIDRLLATVLH